MSHPPTIAYCGPIAEPGRPAAGGKEAGNRSIIDRLRDKGVAVRAFPYPRPDRHGHALVKMAVYGLGLSALLVRLAASSRHWDILHFNGHCRHFIVVECAGFSDAR